MNIEKWKMQIEEKEVATSSFCLFQFSFFIFHSYFENDHGAFGAATMRSVVER